MLDALWLSFVVIFVAELGDKSQLMALSFATRYRPGPILLGITLATLLVHALSVAFGGALGAVVASSWLTLAAALAFFGFAAWTLRGDQLSGEEVSRVGRSTGSAVLAVGSAFFLAELGDKTMLATVALATREEAWGTWLGSTAGMVLADALAIVLGRQLGRRVPERVIRWGAATLFALFGVLLLVEAMAGF